MNDFENIEVLKKKFNWGAFLLGWIWGLFNKSYITLIQIPISFIPQIGGFLTFILAIYFGIKGNDLALKNKHFTSVESFIKYQKTLTCVGILLSITVFAIMGISFQLSALHPAGYDFNITIKTIKVIVACLILSYMIIGVSIFKIRKI